MSKHHIFLPTTFYIPIRITWQVAWRYIASCSNIQKLRNNSTGLPAVSENLENERNIAVSFSLFIDIVTVALGGNISSSTKSDDVHIVGDHNDISNMMKDIIDACSEVIFDNNGVGITYQRETQTPYKNNYLKLLTKKELRICLSIINLISLQYKSTTGQNLIIMDGKKMYKYSGRLEYIYHIPSFSLVDELDNFIDPQKHNEIAKVGDIRINFGSYSHIPALSKTDVSILNLGKSSTRGYQKISKAKSLADVVIDSSNDYSNWGNKHVWFRLQDPDRSRMLEFIRELKNRLNTKVDHDLHLVKSSQLDFINNHGDSNSSTRNVKVLLSKMISDRSPITFDTCINRKILNTYTPEQILENDIRIWGTLRYPTQIASYTQYKDAIRSLSIHDTCKLIFPNGDTEYEFDLEPSTLRLDTIFELNPNIIPDSNNFPEI